MTWDAVTGLLSQTSLGSVTTSYVVSPYGELSSHEATRNNASVLLREEFDRDALGRVTEARERAAGSSSDTIKQFTYDSAARLTSVSVNGAVVERYGFDKNGARTTIEKGGVTQTATYDAQDRLTAFGNATYIYTPDGERFEKRERGEVTQYEHDALGGLRRVTLPNGKRVEYTNNGAGNRVARYIDGVLDRAYLYGVGGHLSAELDANGNVLSQFGYGGGSGAGVPDFMVKGGVTYRIVKDYRGSVRFVVSSATGDIAQRIDYDEWGNVTHDTQPWFQPFGYGGGFWDRDVELLHLGAREYDPEVGQFIEKDPTGFDGGLNLYAYAAGDPVNYIDSTGTVPVLAVYLASMPVGYAVGGVTGALWSIGIQLSEKGCIDWGQVDRDAQRDAAIGAFTGGLGGSILRARRLAKFPILPRSLGAAANIRVVPKESTYAQRLYKKMGDEARRDADNLMGKFLNGHITPGKNVEIYKGHIVLRGDRRARIVLKRVGEQEYNHLGTFEGHRLGDTKNKEILRKIVGK